MSLAYRLCHYALGLMMLAPTVTADGLTARQTQLLTSNCVQCHARPGIGVPIMGKAGDWRERAAQGETRMLINVVQGLRGMPPMGYCSACSEQDFRALIRFMAGLPDPAASPAK